MKSRLACHSRFTLSSMASMAYNNLVPDFWGIWIKYPPTFDQEFGGTAGPETCVSRFVFPRLPPTGSPVQSGCHFIFQLTAVIDVA